MKKAPLVIGIVFIAFLLLASGFGASLYFSTYVTKSLMYSQSMAEKSIADTIDTYVLIAKLDKGNTEEAKQLLNLLLDGQILQIDRLLSYTDDKKTKRFAYKILADIASHRKKYPHTLSNSHQLESDISNILRENSGDTILNSANSQFCQFWGHNT